MEGNILSPWVGKKQSPRLLRPRMWLTCASGQAGVLQASNIYFSLLRKQGALFAFGKLTSPALHGTVSQLFFLEFLAMREEQGPS